MIKMSELTEQHIEVFCKKLIEILEEKFNVNIEYELTNKEEQ